MRITVFTASTMVLIGIQFVYCENDVYMHPGKRNLIRPSTYLEPINSRRGYAPKVIKVSRAPLLDASRPLPCCKDESGGSICRSMKTNDPKLFQQKCSTEPDFSLVVCCKACDEIGVNYRERAATFFTNANHSTNCFDRMSAGYCSRFQGNEDAWSGKRWSCHSEHYRLGFRVCRATCGFCTLDWRNAPEPLKCN